MSSHAAPTDPRALTRRLALPRVAGGPTLITLAIGALLTAAALHGGGGLQLRPLTDVEIVVDLLAGLVGAAAVLVAGAARRPWGAVTLGAMAALAALTALSIGWAAQPDDAWTEANRTLAYLAALAGGVGLVRLAPARWPSLLGGVLLSAVAICGYALVTKVFPDSLATDEVYARLREPYGYWNAVGLTAALGVPACLWLGARRAGHAALNALAYPALGLLLVTLLLAYSRGSLLALIVGCAVWFALVPLRLRGLAVLATSGVAAVLVTAWAFGSDALSEDRIALADRSTAGHQLGILLVAMLVLLLAAGLAIGFAAARRPPAPHVRRRAGLAALVAVGLVPIVALGGLALSQRGLGGSISQGWKDLTDPDVTVQVSNSPDRLTAVGSVRARYWDESLRIFRDHEALGVGAGGYATVRNQYRSDRLDAKHSHGYVVQTLADLGLVGAAVSLALLVAWLAAAGRTLSLWGPRRTTPWTAERIGVATAATIVVVFGVHSFVDWTWFVPGNALVALLCAGWVAGRGPTDEPLRRRSWSPVPWRIGVAAATVVVAAVAAWTAWQPQRAADLGDEALAAAEAGRFDEADAKLTRAREVNPLGVEHLYEQAALEQLAGRIDGARAALRQAVRMQPADASTYLHLARFELGQNQRQAALAAIGPALYLDPHRPSIQQVYLDVTRAGT